MTASSMLARPVRTAPDVCAFALYHAILRCLPAAGCTLPPRQPAAGVQPRLCIPVGRGMTEPPYGLHSNPGSYEFRIERRRNRKVDIRYVRGQAIRANACRNRNADIRYVRGRHAPTLAES